MASRYVTVEAEVCVDEFETQVLIEELKRRNIANPIEISNEKLTAIYYAFKFGKDQEAVDLAKNYVCDVLGKCL
jgi:hypothetical protein